LEPDTEMILMGNEPINNVVGSGGKAEGGSGEEFGEMIN
jgi:hypothetical protein